MKIVHILPGIYVGGGEKFAVDICNELALNDNDDLYLCTLSKADDSYILKKQINSKVTLITLNKRKGFDPIIIFKLYKVLKSIKPDIVHTHLRAIYYSFLSIIFLKKVTFIHTFHTIAEKEANNIVKKNFFQVLFLHFNVIPVSISPLVLESTKNLFGDRYNIMIINGAKPLKKSKKFKEVEKEISEFKNSKNTKILISVGRVSEVKNHLMLIECIKELNEYDENVVLLVLGSLSNEKKYAKNCQDKASNEKNIYFLGEKSNVGDYMFCSDALCISSVREGVPLVVLEAMSAGKPVLSTPVGGIPDVIHDGIHGYLSTDVTRKSYVKILKYFIYHPIVNIDRIKNDYRQKYSLLVCKDKYYELYKLLNRRIS